MQMRINLMVLASVLCAFQAAPAAGTNGATAATPGNPVIVRGTGLEITRGDLDDAVAPIRAQAQSPAQVFQYQRQMLSHIIDIKLLLAKATDEDKDSGQKTAESQLTALKENAASTEAFVQRLKTIGMTEASLRDKIAQDATAQAVLQRELKITVTDDEVKNYYAAHVAEFEKPEIAHVSHILIFTVDPITHTALPDDQLLARRRLAEGVVKTARAGADFGKLAKQYSEDPGSRANDGELTPFPRGQMSPEIDAAAFSLTNNQVSDVITTSIGYQIIKLLDKTPSKTADYLAAATNIKQGLTQQKTAKLGPVYMNNLRKAAAVEILDPDLKPVATTNSDVLPPPVTAAKP
jgi:parvulin-like peptidyl-prolyl isomerase